VGHPKSEITKGAFTGLPDWPFHGQFRKIWPFLNWAGHEKTHLAILQNLAIFWPFFWFVTVKLSFH